MPAGWPVRVGRIHRTGVREGRTQLQIRHTAAIHAQQGPVRHLGAREDLFGEVLDRNVGDLLQKRVRLCAKREQVRRCARASSRV